MVLIPGSGSFRRGTETELLRNGSSKKKLLPGFYCKITEQKRKRYFVNGSITETEVLKHGNFAYFAYFALNNRF